MSAISAFCAFYGDPYGPTQNSADMLSASKRKPSKLELQFNIY